jgi:hypothetical protein
MIPIGGDHDTIRWGSWYHSLGTVVPFRKHGTIRGIMIPIGGDHVPFGGGDVQFSG